jgi:hypothetical protein
MYSYVTVKLTKIKDIYISKQKTRSENTMLFFLKTKYQYGDNHTLKCVLHNMSVVCRPF